MLFSDVRGVVVRFSGVASDHDLRQANRAFHDHPSFETLEYSIIDFTDVTKLDFSSHAARLIADNDFKASKRNPSLRLAIVGGGLNLIGLANMYRTLFELQTGPWKQGQFATVDEARAWVVGEDQRRE